MSITLIEHIRPHVQKLAHDRTIIDCGHTPVFFDSQVGIHFERPDSPLSETAIDTVRSAAILANELLSLGHQVTISVCYTDTSYSIPHLEHRALLKHYMEHASLEELLPDAYLTLFNDHGISLDLIRISLQSQNSNRFANALKKIRREAKSISPEQMIQKYGALFISRDNELGLTNKFLFNKNFVSRSLGFDWWQHSYYHISDRDIVTCPFIKLIQLQYISLYDKERGILCPSTYGGLLMQFEDQAPCNIIALYHRNDDSDIGEKVLRGIISKEVICPSDSHYLHVVTTKDDSYEVSCFQYAHIVPETNSTELLELYHASAIAHNSSPLT